MLARAAPMLGLDLSDLIPAEAAALITVHDSRVEFRHPLARSAIYGDSPAERRRDGAPCSGRRAARRRRRPPCLASRARLVRSRRRRIVGARAGRPACTPAQRLRGLVTGVRARCPAGTRTRSGRAGCCMPRPTPPGSAASRTGPRRFWTRPAGTTPLRSWRYRSSICAATSPPAAGRSAEAQQILLAAAERAAPIDPERAVVMLAEAVNASFYAGDAATMRLAAERAASLAPAGLLTAARPSSH